MTTKTPDELTQEIERLKAERDTYRTLSGVGTWHNDCRPNRQMAARELEKSQAVIDKLADTITELKAQLTALSAPSLSPAVQEKAEALMSVIMAYRDDAHSPSDHFPRIPKAIDVLIAAVRAETGDTT